MSNDQHRQPDKDQDAPNKRPDQDKTPNRDQPKRETPERKSDIR